LDYREENQRYQIEFELGGAIFDRTGKAIHTYTETIRGAIAAQELEAAKRAGLHYAKRLALKPGLYNVRVGWREKATDRIGTAAAWVDVPNLSRHKLTLSNILLTRDSSNDAQISTMSVGSEAFNSYGVKYYKTGSPVVYYLMVYNAPPNGEAELMMHSEIFKAGEMIHQTESQPVAARVIGNDRKGLEVGGQLTLSLPRGLYELRISITNPKSKQSAERVVPFGIEG